MRRPLDHEIRAALHAYAQNIDTCGGCSSPVDVDEEGRYTCPACGPRPADSYVEPQQAREILAAAMPMLIREVALQLAETGNALVPILAYFEDPAAAGAQGEADAKEGLDRVVDSLHELAHRLGKLQ